MYLRNNRELASLSIEYMILLRNAVECGGTCRLSNIFHQHKKWNSCDGYHTAAFHFLLCILLRDLQDGCLATVAALIAPVRVKNTIVSDLPFPMRNCAETGYLSNPGNVTGYLLISTCFAPDDFAQAMKTFRPTFQTSLSPQFGGVFFTLIF